jgi:hypothetical protein
MACLVSCFSERRSIVEDDAAGGPVDSHQPESAHEYSL